MPKNPKKPFQRRPGPPTMLPQAAEGERGPRQEAAYDDPGGRARWFRRSRIGADRRVLRGLIARASSAKRRAERALQNRSTTPSTIPTPPGEAGSVNWASLGPTKVDGGQAGAVHAVVSGRVTSIVAGPGGTRAYVGTANGGVWVTEDDGTTWTALDEFANTPASGSGAITSSLEADSLAVGAIAVKFGAARASDTIFVGTGEPGGNTDGYFGIGIKSSTDGGNTFSLEATNLASNEVYRIVIDPDNVGIVFAATTTGLFQRPTAAPFTTWNQISSPNFASANGLATDVIVAGKGGSKNYYVAFQGDNVFQSTDSGVTWNKVPGFAGSGRIALAAGESDPSVIYALVADGTLNRMDSGTRGSFQQVSGVPKALFAGGQGWYDAVVAADPADANTVYLMGDLTLDTDWAVSFYKGTIIGGPGSFVFPFNSANDQTTSDPKTTNNVPLDPTWIGRGIHPDGHALAFATNADGSHDGSIAFVGSDGGVFISTSSGTLNSFAAKNQGLNITQMTYIAQRPDTADIMYGGCQDNGTIRFSVGSSKSWLEVVEGDGGGVAIDPNNPKQVIRQYIRADLEVTSDDGANWADAGLPVASNRAEDLRSGFYGPLKSLAAGSKTVVAFGTNRLWFRPDWGQPWQSLPSNSTSDVLDDPNPTVIPSNAQPTIVPVTAIAIASDTRVFAATSQSPPVASGLGQVWRFDFAAGAWTKQALPALPNTAPGVRFFTALAVEDPVAGTVYVTLGSGGGEHVFYFDGNAWQNAGFSATNVDVPMHAVAVDPGNTTDVYVGTDVGVWKGSRSGNAWTWTAFSQGLPEAAVTDLTIHAFSRKLRAATHGRGVWEIPLSPASSSSSSVSSSSSDSSSSSSSSSGSSSSDSSSSSSSSSSDPAARIPAHLESLPVLSLVSLMPERKAGVL